MTKKPFLFTAIIIVVLLFGTGLLYGIFWAYQHSATHQKQYFKLQSHQADAKQVCLTAYRQSKHYAFFNQPHFHLTTRVVTEHCPAFTHPQQLKAWLAQQVTLSSQCKLHLECTSSYTKTLMVPLTQAEAKRYL